MHFRFTIGIYSWFIQMVFDSKEPHCSKRTAPSARWGSAKCYTAMDVGDPCADLQQQKAQLQQEKADLQQQKGGLAQQVHRLRCELRENLQAKVSLEGQVKGLAVEKARLQKGHEQWSVAWAAAQPS